MIDNHPLRPNFKRLRLSPNMLRVMSNLDQGHPFYRNMTGRMPYRTITSLVNRGLIEFAEPLNYDSLRLSETGQQFSAWYKGNCI